MTIIYQSASNTGVQGYLPQFSTTIKSLAISATGFEIFDLGENWQLIDNLLVSLVNCVDSTSSSVVGTFSNVATTLSSSAVNPAETMAGAAPNAASRVVNSAGLSGVVFALKVSARFVRIRVLNGSSSAQALTSFVDIKGFSLTP